MPATGSVKRVLAFLRSVLPADPKQLLLLAGATFLFIAPSLRWWPEISLGMPTAFGQRLMLWAGSVRLLLLPMMVGAAGGYSVSLRKAKDPAHRLVTVALAPAFAGLLAVWGLAAYFRLRQLSLATSVFSRLSSVLWERSLAVARLAWELGPGLHFAFAGCLLVLVVALLARLGRLDLPLSLQSPPVSSETRLAGNNQEMKFAWMMICIPFFAQILVGLTITFPYILGIRQTEAFPPWIAWLERGLGTLVFGFLILWAMGEARGDVIRQSFRIPRLQYVSLAILFPAVIASVWPAISYLYDRVYWTQNDFSRAAVLPLRDYFGWPGVAALWYLIPALVEEVGWRGYLQPRFVRRYGLFRGIFLVGVVWGAFHFSSGFHPSMDYVDVVTHLALRFASCAAYSYVYGWLTIRSGSVLPAALTHGTSNMFILSGLPVRTEWWLLTVFWAILAIVLFRYWPLQPGDEDVSSGRLGEAAAV
jgi:membrane protease YdiL (CAAX protease family)